MRGRTVSIRRGVPVALLAAFASAACDREVPLEPGAETAAAIAPADARAGDVIPGRFIVTLRSDALPSEVAAAHGVRPDFVYRAALNGFAGAMSEAARSGLMGDARVTLIEPDRRITLSTTQTNATWGLDRIDQRALPLSGSYTYNQTGSGVNAYIIDTGIRLTHNDFGGRALAGFDAVTSGGNANDCNGHGTHVAGTVGGTTWGVAKSVTLYAVRVLDCQGSGTTSGVIAGVDWVTANHRKPAVANMSLGGGASSTLDNAVNSSISAGVSYAVAAGNGDFFGRAQNACNYSPARVAAAMTIGATTNTDAKTSWSNYGNCVDWFAPGASITSAWHSSNTATNTISGTSMAAPHVAGVAALYLHAHPGATPTQVRDALYDLTTKGIVTNSNTANNHLLYSLIGDGGGSEPPPPPPPPPGGFELTASASKVKGVVHVDLSWSGASSTSVDVYRDGSRIATTANDGAHTDNTGLRGGGSLTYQVCETNTSTCSNTVTVSY